MVNVQCRHVIIMSLASMFLMGIFQILTLILILVDEIKFKKNPFSAVGLHCLTVIYATVALTALSAPFLIYFIGPKLAMLIGCASYTLFVVCMIHPILEITYLAGIIFGMGSALIWTAQAIYLVKNSSQLTISKYCSIFWILLQISVFSGSAFVYLRFLDLEDIDGTVRMTVIWVLLGLSFTSFIFISLLPRYTDGYNLYKSIHKKRKMLKLSFGIVRIIRSKPILLLCIPFFFLGFYIIFLTMNYSIVVGHATQLERPRELAHFIGVFVGLGGITGGCALLASAVYINKSHRVTKVVIGCVLLIMALFMMFLNLPNEASFYDTDDSSVIEPSATFIICSSFLLGIADSCFSTQIIETSVMIFPKMVAIVFPVFKTVQAVGVLMAILYSTFIALYGVLAILVVLSVFTVICLIISASIVIDQDKVFQKFGQEDKLSPKTRKASNLDSKDYSSDPSQEDSPKTSRPSTSSSESSESKSSSFSQSRENTPTISETNTPPSHPPTSSSASEDSNISVKSTLQEPKITKLASVRKGTINFFRKFFGGPNQTTPDIEEPAISLQSIISSKTFSSPQVEVATSTSGDKLSRSISRISISPTISRPPTPPSINESETQLSQSKSPPISNNQEHQSFLKRLVSIPVRLPWLAPEGIKDVKKLTTDDRKPSKPMIPRVRVKTVPTAVSLRDDSLDTLSTRSEEKFNKREDRGNIPNKGILRTTNVNTARSSEGIGIPLAKTASTKR